MCNGNLCVICVFQSWCYLVDDLISRFNVLTNLLTNEGWLPCKEVQRHGILGSHDQGQRCSISRWQIKVKGCTRRCWCCGWQRLRSEIHSLHNASRQARIPGSWCKFFAISSWPLKIRCSTTGGSNLASFCLCAYFLGIDSRLWRLSELLWNRPSNNSLEEEYVFKQLGFHCIHSLEEEYAFKQLGFHCVVDVASLSSCYVRFWWVTNK